MEEVSTSVNSFASKVYTHFFPIIFLRLFLLSLCIFALFVNFNFIRFHQEAYFIFLIASSSQASSPVNEPNQTKFNIEFSLLARVPHSWVKWAKKAGAN